MGGKHKIVIFDGREQMAFGADEPARKERDGHTDKIGGIERILSGFRAARWGEQLCHLWAEDALYGGEQAFFDEVLCVPGIPIVEAHDERGHIGKVDDRTDSVGQEELAGANLTNRIFFG